MRRLRLLIVPILFALLVVISNVFQNILASEGWNRFREHPFVQKWGLLIQVGFVLLFAVIYVAWDALRVKDDAGEPGHPPLQMRQRLVNRVLEFAQSQFDGGLYAKARHEFTLAERPLRVTTEDRLMDVRIEPHYRRLNGPLVILGKPGTGKTTLLYELATILCSPNESVPIPVVFGLSSWTSKADSLTDWMVRELQRTYGVGEALARTWVSNEVILPLLDGLDEVSQAHRAGCVKRINEYREAHPGVKFAVSCREDEYRDLRATFDVPSAVVVQALSREDVRAFLDSHAPKFAGLRQALRTDTELSELIDTPLMLWVAAFAFEHASMSDVPTGRSTKERLFEHYVDAMLMRDRGSDLKGPSPFQASDIRVWLQRTAECLTRAGFFSFSLEDLSSEWLPRRQRTAAVWTIRCAGVLAGLAVGALVGQLIGGARFAFLTMFVGAIGGALGSLDREGFIDSTTPADGLAWSWAHARINGFIAFVVTLPLAALSTAIAGIGEGLIVGTFSSLCLWVLYGFATATVQKRTSVNGGLKQSVKCAAVMALPFLGLALLARPYTSPMTFTLGLFAANVVIMVLLVKGGGFCVKNLTMRVLLARGGHIPWRYEALLSVSVQRALMIQQGGTFRFIHRALQEHLAAGGSRELS